MFAGFGTLMVSYRGSLGCGKKFVEASVGRVGTQDVYHCYVALQRALQKMPWLDKKRVILYGGSYGGFLATHLSSQYPVSTNLPICSRPVYVAS